MAGWLDRGRLAGCDYLLFVVRCHLQIPYATMGPTDSSETAVSALTMISIGGFCSFGLRGHAVALGSDRTSVDLRRPAVT